MSGFVLSMADLECSTTMLRVGEIFGEFGVQPKHANLQQVEDAARHGVSKWQLQVLQGDAVFVEEEIPVARAFSKVVKLRASTLYSMRVRLFSQPHAAWGPWSREMTTRTYPTVTCSATELGEDHVRVSWDRQLRDTTGLENAKFVTESMQKVADISQFELRIVREVDMREEFLREFPPGVRSCTVQDLQPATAYIMSMRYMTLIGTMKQWTEVCRFITQSAHALSIRQRTEDAVRVHWERPPPPPHDAGYLIGDPSVHRIELSLEGRDVLPEPVTLAPPIDEYIFKALKSGTDYCVKFRYITKEGRWSSRARPLNFRSVDRLMLTASYVRETFAIISWSRTREEPDVEPLVQVRLRNRTLGTNRDLEMSPVDPKVRAVVLSGLVGGTQYEVSMRAKLGADGAWGLWSSPLEFTTRAPVQCFFQDRGEDFLGISWKQPTGTGGGGDQQNNNNNNNDHTQLLPSAMENSGFILAASDQHYSRQQGGGLHAMWQQQYDEEKKWFAVVQQEKPDGTWDTVVSGEVRPQGTPGSCRVESLESKSRYRAQVRSMQYNPLTRESQWGEFCNWFVARTLRAVTIQLVDVGEDFADCVWSRALGTSDGGEAAASSAGEQSWTDLRYEIVLACIDTGVDRIIHREVLTNSFVLSNLSPNTGYMLSVRACDENNQWGKWCSLTFHTLSPVLLDIHQVGEDYARLFWRRREHQSAAMDGGGEQNGNDAFPSASSFTSTGAAPPPVPLKGSAASYAAAANTSSTSGGGTGGGTGANSGSAASRNMLSPGSMSSGADPFVAQYCLYIFSDDDSVGGHVCPETGYRRGGRSSVRRVLTLAPQHQSFRVGDLEPDRVYTAVMRAATVSNKWGPWSHEVRFRTVAPFRIPVNQLSVGENYVALMWARDDHPIVDEGVVVGDYAATSQQVRVTGIDVTFEDMTVLPPEQRSYKIFGLAPATAYSVRLRSCNRAGEWGVWSSPVHIMTRATILVRNVEVAEDFITVEWEKRRPPNPRQFHTGRGNAITAYHLQVTNAQGQHFEAYPGDSECPFTIHGLQPDTFYKIEMKANYNNEEWGQWSAPLWCLTMPALDVQLSLVAEDFCDVHITRPQQAKRLPQDDGNLVEQTAAVAAAASSSSSGAGHHMYSSEDEITTAFGRARPMFQICVTTPDRAGAAAAAMAMASGGTSVAALMRARRGMMKDSVPQHIEDQKLVYSAELQGDGQSMRFTVPNLRPSTVYRVNVRSRLPDGTFGMWSGDAQFSTLAPLTVECTQIGEDFLAVDWHRKMAAGHTTQSQLATNTSPSAGNAMMSPGVLSLGGTIKRSRVRVKDSSGAVRNVISVDSEDMHVTIKDLVPATTYIIAVQTQNDNHDSWGLWSEETRARTLPGINVQVERVGEDAAWISWARDADTAPNVTTSTVVGIDGGVKTYDVQVCDPVTHFVAQRQITGPNCFFRGLIPDTKYEVKVRGESKQGFWGIWAPRIFRTLPTMRVTFGNIGEHFVIVEWRRNLPSSTDGTVGVKAIGDKGAASTSASAAAGGSGGAAAAGGAAGSSASAGGDAPSSSAAAIAAQQQAADNDVTDKFRLRIQLNNERPQIFELPPSISSFRLDNLRASSEYRVWMCARGHERVWGPWNLETRVRTVPQLALMIEDIGENYVKVVWKRNKWEGMSLERTDEDIKTWIVESAVTAYHVKVVDDSTGDVVAKEKLTYTLTKCAVPKLRPRTVYAVTVCSEDTYKERGLWVQPRRFLTLEGVTTEPLLVGESFITLHWNRESLFEPDAPPGSEEDEVTDDTEAWLQNAREQQELQSQQSRATAAALAEGEDEQQRLQRMQLEVRQNADAVIESGDNDVTSWHVRIFGCRIFGGLPGQEWKNEFSHPGDVTSMRIPDLNPHCSYSYAVRAKNKRGEWGSWSNAITLETLPLLVCQAQYVGEDFVEVAWKRPVPNHPDEAIQKISCFPINESTALTTSHDNNNNNNNDNGSEEEFEGDDVQSQQQQQQPGRVSSAMTAARNFRVTIAPIMAESRFCRNSASNDMNKFFNEDERDPAEIVTPTVYETPHHFLRIAHLRPGARYRVTVQEQQRDKWSNELLPEVFGHASQDLIIDTIDPMTVSATEIGETYCQVAWERAPRFGDFNAGGNAGGAEEGKVPSNAVVTAYEYEAMRLDDKAEMPLEGPEHLRIRSMAPATSRDLFLKRLVPNCIYGVRVRAQTDKAHWGVWSPVMKFVTTQRYNINVDLVSEDNVVLQWYRLLPLWAPGNETPSSGRASSNSPDEPDTEDPFAVGDDVADTTVGDDDEQLQHQASDDDEPQAKPRQSDAKKSRRKNKNRLTSVTVDEASADMFQVTVTGIGHTFHRTVEIEGLGANFQFKIDKLSANALYEASVRSLSRSTGMWSLPSHKVCFCTLKSTNLKILRYAEAFISISWSRDSQMVTEHTRALYHESQRVAKDFDKRDMYVRFALQQLKEADQARDPEDAKTPAEVDKERDLYWQFQLNNLDRKNHTQHLQQENVQFGRADVSAFQLCCYGDKGMPIVGGRIESLLPDNEQPQQQQQQNVGGGGLASSLPARRSSFITQASLSRLAADASRHSSTVSAVSPAFVEPERPPPSHADLQLLRRQQRRRQRFLEEERSKQQKLEEEFEAERRRARKGSAAESYFEAAEGEAAEAERQQQLQLQQQSDDGADCLSDHDDGTQTPPRRQQQQQDLLSPILSAENAAAAIPVAAVPAAAAAAAEDDQIDEDLALGEVPLLFHMKLNSRVHDCMLRGLSAGSSYALVIRSRNAAGEWGPWSEHRIVRTLDIIDLRQSYVGEHYVNLCWLRLSRKSMRMYERERLAVKEWERAAGQTTFSVTDLHELKATLSEEEYKTRISELRTWKQRQRALKQLQVDIADGKAELDVGSSEQTPRQYILRLINEAGAVDQRTIDAAQARQLTLSGLAPNSFFAAVVCADYGNGIYGEWSDPVRFLTQNLLHLSVTYVGERFVDIEWRRSLNRRPPKGEENVVVIDPVAHQPKLEFQVCIQSSAGVDERRSVKGRATYRIDRLVAHTRYTVSVREWDSKGEWGLWSTTKSVHTLPAVKAELPDIGEDWAVVNWARVCEPFHPANDSAVTFIPTDITGYFLSVEEVDEGVSVAEKAAAEAQHISEQEAAASGRRKALGEGVAQDLCDEEEAALAAARASGAVPQPGEPIPPYPAPEQGEVGVPDVVNEPPGQQQHEQQRYALVKRFSHDVDTFKLTHLRPNRFYHIKVMCQTSGGHLGAWSEATVMLTLQKIALSPTLIDEETTRVQWVRREPRSSPLVDPDKVRVVHGRYQCMEYEIEAVNFDGPPQEKKSSNNNNSSRRKSSSGNSRSDELVVPSTTTMVPPPGGDEPAAAEEQDPKPRHTTARYHFRKVVAANVLDWKLTDLQINGQYCVRIRSKDTRGRYSLWSDNLHFVTHENLTVLPIKITENFVWIDWFRLPQPESIYATTDTQLIMPQEMSAQYRLQVFCANDMTSALLDKTFAGTIRRYQLSGLRPNTAYVIQVRGCNVAGEWGQYSQQRTVYTMKLISVDVLAVGEGYIAIGWARDRPDELPDVAEADAVQTGITEIMYASSGKAAEQSGMHDDAAAEEEANAAVAAVNSQIKRRYPLLDTPAVDDAIYVTEQTRITRFSIWVRSDADLDGTITEVAASDTQRVLADLDPDCRYTITIRALYGDEDWGLWSSSTSTATLNRLSITVKNIGEDYLSSMWQRAANTFDIGLLEMGNMEETLCYQFCLFDVTDLADDADDLAPHVPPPARVVRDLLTTQRNLSIANLIPHRRYRLTVRRWYKPVTTSNVFNMDVPLSVESSNDDNDPSQQHDGGNNDNNNSNNNSGDEKKDVNPLEESRRLQKVVSAAKGQAGSWSDAVFVLTLRPMFCIAQDIAEDMIHVRWERDPSLARAFVTRPSTKVLVQVQSYHVRIDELTHDGTAERTGHGTLHFDQQFPPDETAFRVTDLRADGVYRIQVRCCSDRAWGLWSRPCVAVTLPRISVSIETIGEDYAVVNWFRNIRALRLPSGHSAVTGSVDAVEKYQLEMYGLEHAYHLEKKFRASRTSYRIKRLEPQTLYSVAVRSCDGGGMWSLWSDKITFVTLKPLKVSFGKIGEQFFHINWRREPQTEAEYANYAALRSTATSNQPHHQLQNDDSSQNAVTAAAAAASSGELSLAKPSAPPVLVGDTAIVSYHLCVFAIEQGPTTAIVDKQVPGDQLSYRVTGLLPGSPYIVIVRACNSEGSWGLWSEERMVTTLRLFDVSVVSIGENYISVKWHRDPPPPPTGDNGSGGGHPTNMNSFADASTETIVGYRLSVTGDQPQRSGAAGGGAVSAASAAAGGAAAAAGGGHHHHQHHHSNSPSSTAIEERFEPSQAEGNVFIVRGLTPDSKYTIGLQCDYGDDEWGLWSAPVTFLTLNRLGMLVSNITEERAELTWGRAQQSPQFAFDPNVVVWKGSVVKYQVVIRRLEVFRRAQEEARLAGLADVPVPTGEESNTDDVRVIEREMDLRQSKYIQTFCIVDRLQVKTDYHVQIRALDDFAVWGEWSEVLFDTPPNPPSHPVLRKIGANVLELRWEPPDSSSRYLYCVEQSVTKEASQQQPQQPKKPGSASALGASTKPGSAGTGAAAAAASSSSSAGETEWRLVDTFEDPQCRIRVSGPLHKVRCRVRCCKLDRAAHLWSKFSPITALSAALPPEPVATLALSALSRTSATVEWTRPDNAAAASTAGSGGQGSPRLMYKVALSVRDQPAVMVAATRATSYELVDLSPGTPYRVQVQVESDSGTSNRNPILKFTTKTDDRQASGKLPMVTAPSVPPQVPNRTASISGASGGQPSSRPSTTGGSASARTAAGGGTVAGAASSAYGAGGGAGSALVRPPNSAQPVTRRPQPGNVVNQQQQPQPYEAASSVNSQTGAADPRSLDASTSRKRPTVASSSGPGTAPPARSSGAATGDYEVVQFSAEDNADTSL